MNRNLFYKDERDWLFACTTIPDQLDWHWFQQDVKQYKKQWNYFKMNALIEQNLQTIGYCKFWRKKFNFPNPLDNT